VEADQHRAPLTEHLNLLTAITSYITLQQFYVQVFI